MSSSLALPKRLKVSHTMHDSASISLFSVRLFISYIASGLLAADLSSFCHSFSINLLEATR